MIVAVRTTSGRETSVVESIVARINSRLMKEIEIGDLVKIKKGAFKGKNAEVLEINEEEEMVKIKIENSDQVLELSEKDASVEKKKRPPIKAILQTEDLRGYIFIEAENEDRILEAVRGIPHVRGIVGKEVKIDQLERFIIPERRVVKIEVGDIVEIVSGPFKGERAKVTRVDEIKQELVVELLEAAIPIPVTIPITIVRLYEKKKTTQ